MDFDFALLLVVLTAVTGVIWLLDAIFLKPRRRARASEILNTVGGSSGVKEQLGTQALREPVLVEYARSFFPVILIVLLFRSFIAEPFKIPSGSMMPTLLVGDFILVNKFAYGLRLPVLGTKLVDIGEPHRGDVFVFKYPGFSCTVDGKPVRSGKPCEYPLAPVPRLDYIKRVIGLPGDTITYRNKTLYVNGEEAAQTDVGPFVGTGMEGRRMAGAEIHAETLSGVRHDVLESNFLPPGREGTWVVPAGHYFAMGDNRDNSEDGRYWGFVPEKNLIGKAFVVWMNWDGGIDFKRIGTLIK